MQNILQKQKPNTFISRVHRIFSRVDYILGQKPSLNKFKKFEITPSIFSKYNGKKLEINSRRKTG